MTDLLSSTPSEALKARLDDPKVAAALSMMLDNADTLAIGLVALDGLLRRADTISGNITGSLADVKAIGDSFAYLLPPTKRLAADAPQIADAAEALLESGMLSREVVDLLGNLAGALVKGAAAARTNGTTVAGVFPALRALKDPDVARGLGFLIEVSRALGEGPVTGVHELSMAQAVVRTVADAVPGRTVTVVTVRIGVASGVVPEALRFSWDVVTQDTPLAGSRLDVVRVPLSVTCHECGATTDVADPVRVRCGACGGRSVDVAGGQELEIASVEIDDEDREGVAV